MIHFGSAATSSRDGEPSGIHRTSEDVLAPAPWGVPASMEAELYTLVRPYIRGKTTLRLISPFRFRHGVVKAVKALFFIRFGETWIGPVDTEELERYRTDYPLMTHDHIYAIYSSTRILQRVLATTPEPVLETRARTEECPF
jgi:hypothetical protein